MKWLEVFMEWIFPSHCVICFAVLPFSQKDKILCRDCREDIPWLSRSTCEKCGREVHSSISICKRCQYADFVFQKGIAVFPYAVVRRGISRFKFKEYPLFAKPYGSLMGEYMKGFHMDLLDQVDLLIPVPIYAKKQKKRGFNQSELLAKVLSEEVGIPWDTGVLIRHRHTEPQSGLNPKERLENIQGVFSVVRKEALLGKRILLIDDIFTTGSTVNECAKVLYAGGASWVGFYTLSIVPEEV